MPLLSAFALNQILIEEFPENIRVIVEPLLGKICQVQQILLLGCVCEVNYFNAHILIGPLIFSLEQIRVLALGATELMAMHVSILLGYKNVFISEFC